MGYPRRRRVKGKVLMLQIDMDRNHIAAFCKKNGIRRLSVFGSAIRDDFRDDSDVDVLVEFLPGRTPGFAFFEMEAELGRLIGRKVDFNTPKFLPTDFRGEAMSEAETVFEQA